MNNLKRFNTEAEYQQASLNYPAVSWVTSGDTVHFDRTAPTPPVVNDKVMMAWHNGAHNAGDIQLANLGSTDPTEIFNTLTLNDVDVLPLVKYDGSLADYALANTDYVAKYGLKVDSTITDIFSGDLGGNWGSDTPRVDFLIPAQVTEINSIPSDVVNLVIEASTPPTTSIDWSGFSGTVYVPDNAVSVYQSVLSGSNVNVQAISTYQGNLPV